VATAQSTSGSCSRIWPPRNWPRPAAGTTRPPKPATPSRAQPRATPRVDLGPRRGQPWRAPIPQVASHRAAMTEPTSLCGLSYLHQVTSTSLPGRADV